MDGESRATLMLNQETLERNRSSGLISKGWAIKRCLPRTRLALLAIGIRLILVDLGEHPTPRAASYGPGMPHETRPVRCQGTAALMVRASLSVLELAVFRLIAASIDSITCSYKYLLRALPIYTLSSLTLLSRHR